MKKSLPAKSLDRRTVLRGALWGVPVAVGLPTLEAMLDPNGTALAAGLPLPQKFGVWFFGGGVVKTNGFFFPTTTGPNVELTEMLAPLASVKSYLTLVSGTITGKIPGNGGHFSHRSYTLSNTYYTTETIGYPGVGTVPSLDQMVVDGWNPSTPLPSLQLGVHKHPDARHMQTSWKAGYKLLNYERSPAKVYARLFSSGTQPAGVPLKALIDSQRSVLDATLDSGKRLSARLSTTDRRRLDDHMTAVREVEKRLLASPTELPACSPGAAPPAGMVDAGLAMETVNNLQSDLVALALSCGRTRVFSYTFSCSSDLTVYSNLGESEGYHVLTHNRDWYLNKARNVVLFKMKQLAYLAEKLRTTPDGAGNLLDSTMVYVSSEFQSANAHDKVDHPVVLLGKGGGAVGNATHVRLPGTTSLGAVMIAMLNGLGIPTKTLGDQTNNPEVYATAPAPGLIKGI